MNPETWILARTDARQVYDLDEAMRRAERYIRAGADGIFIEAPRSVEELRRIGRAFDVPQVCNPLMGGHTPILSMEELGELGFNCAVLGLDTLMHAAKAIETVLLDMKSGKFARRNDGMDFEQYKSVVGFDKWASVDERFAASSVSPRHPEVQQRSCEPRRMRGRDVATAVPSPFGLARLRRLAPQA